MYRIENAVSTDLPMICQLFEEAIAFLRANHFIGWTSYDQEFIKSDIERGLLFKVVNNNEIACIFSICFNDELIWREKETGNAIYLHRIVLNRAFSGEKLFSKVLEWAIKFAKERKLDYIRMDTWAENDKIVAYYKSYGFILVENYTTPETDQLPVQHRNLNVSLLQLEIV